jgi:aldose 1-epimerase
LGNESGFSLQGITYGATITSLHVPDRHGVPGDVVLGFDDLKSYLAPHPYLGAVVGRVAGRISGARFKLDGRLHELAVNDPPNHLHGGLVGFNRRLWLATPLSRTDGGAALQFSYHSPDGEEGYPGAVDVKVTYTVTAANALVMETEATTDQADSLQPYPALLFQSCRGRFGNDRGAQAANSGRCLCAYRRTNDAARAPRTGRRPGQRF